MCISTPRLAQSEGRRFGSSEGLLLPAGGVVLWAAVTPTQRNRTSNYMYIVNYNIQLPSVLPTLGEIRVAPQAALCPRHFQCATTSYEQKRFLANECWQLVWNQLVTLPSGIWRTSKPSGMPSMRYAPFSQNIVIESKITEKIVRKISQHVGYQTNVITTSVRFQMMDSINSQRAHGGSFKWSSYSGGREIVENQCANKFWAIVRWRLFDNEPSGDLRLESNFRKSLQHETGPNLSL